MTWSRWQAAVVQAEGKKRLLLGVSQYMGIAIQTKQKKSGDTRADHAVHSQCGVDLPNKTGGRPVSIGSSSTQTTQRSRRTGRRNWSAEDDVRESVRCPKIDL